MNSISWKIWVDTGGTFTDCIAVSPLGELKRLKVLSSSLLRVKTTNNFQNKLTVELPINFSKNFLNGFSVKMGGETRTIHHYNPLLKEIRLNRPFHRKTVIDSIEISSDEEVPVFAARLLTETGLIENFPPIEMKLGSTRGTNALLERKGARTAFLVTKGFKDLILIGNQQRQNLFALSIIKENPLYTAVLEVDERVEADGSVLLPLLTSEIDRIVDTLKKKKVDSVAVTFLNSYKDPIHEKLLGRALQRAGFQYISLSHQLSSQIKILPRAETTIVNAYLDPIIHQYISNIQSVIVSSSIKVMSSAGGLLHSSDFRPKDSLLSGPAGGVIGALTKAKQSGIDQIITFDMGGTSTDVSRCNGRPDYRFDCTVGSLKIFSPSLAIETIAAGGGSICKYDGYRFMVGPHSAGASPGPACYGTDGPLTITDINLLLGRLDAENFSIPIKLEKSEKALQELIRSIKKKKGREIQKEEVLESFIDIANEKMAEAIRKISIQKGHEPKDYTLFCFGGAGGQHACSLAALLGVHHIVVPYDAGLLSAYGIGHASLECVREKLVLKNLSEVLHQLDLDYLSLYNEAKQELLINDQNSYTISLTSRLIFLRLKGQETSLEVEFMNKDEIEKSFIEQYKRVYGHWLDNRAIEVESIRVIVTSQGEVMKPIANKGKSYTPQAEKIKEIYFSGSWKKCPVIKWENLSPGAHVAGPALIVSNNSTVFVEDGWSFQLDENQNANIKQVRVQEWKNIKSDEAQLELFTNRFTAIAEEMGILLQRTSFSVNVKERLDFSCALLDASGTLVVNAPHIPVHLGSMGVCVRAVMKTIELKDGDVILTNHPAFGGSHLPDITLIKPVFFKKQHLGFVANRAHHAEIGGRKPGSMPADASCLEEEGVVISPTYLVKRGIPQWEIIENILTTAPYPTRSLQENLADLNGALAALMLGADATKNLCDKFGVEALQFYMQLLRQHAAELMRDKIKNLSGLYKAEEFLDDGAKLKVAIIKEKKHLRIDFKGSAPVHAGNLNATKAIVHSVVLYVLRLLVNEPLPLNEGLLQPVKLIIPSGMLNPKFSIDNKKSPAVVGGNTEISQRLTDTLLKAFKLAACSQGTMNNFLFGNEKFGYYETICGGVGAGPGFHGAHAVHQHMTNTRITDPEILEYRYPVRLEKFEIRKGSGGDGKWNGGDGIVRQFYFKETLDVNILSQHRVVAPFGMNGGQPGKTGEQFIIHADKRKEKLKGIDGVQVQRGDRMLIKTPGGGGWGKKEIK